MSKPASMELRERAMSLLASGESVRSVGTTLGVSPSSVVKWSQRLRRTGSVAPGRSGGRTPLKIAGAHRDWLIERTRAGAFTLRGLVAELSGRGLKVDYRTVWKFVHREGIRPPKPPAAESKPSSPGKSASIQSI
jgi:transposase